MLCGISLSISLLLTYLCYLMVFFVSSVLLGSAFIVCSPVCL